jgi:hypothetical protein
MGKKLEENNSLADNEVEIIEINGRRLVEMRGTKVSIEHLVNDGFSERSDNDEFILLFHIPREAITGLVLF